MLVSKEPLGKRVSGIETIKNGRRVRYEHGATWEHGIRYAWVMGAIGQKYDQLGGPSSWLGLPLNDEQEMSEGGQVSMFDVGCIYWWPDVGAIEFGNVIVQYTGLLCFGETDADGFFSDSDEPYAIVGVVSPLGRNRSQVADLRSRRCRREPAGSGGGIPGYSLGVKLAGRS